jgi:hypothetical protein
MLLGDQTSEFLGDGVPQIYVILKRGTQFLSWIKSQSTRGEKQINSCKNERKALCAFLGRLEWRFR